jgi:hypothetical protein
MKLHPSKTERGWELADEKGIFESEETSTVYDSRHEAQIAADKANSRGQEFDEYRALEAMVP